MELEEASDKEPNPRHYLAYLKDHKVHDVKVLILVPWLKFCFSMSSGTISRAVSLVSREVTELSLPESLLRDSPAGKSKSLSPDNRKTLAPEKPDDKLKPNPNLKPSPDVRRLLGTEKSEDRLKPQTRSRSRSPVTRSPSFGSKTPSEAWVTKGPGGIIIPL